MSFSFFALNTAPSTLNTDFEMDRNSPAQPVCQQVKTRSQTSDDSPWGESRGQQSNWNTGEDGRERIPSVYTSSLSPCNKAVDLYSVW